ncbi:hypothetical protein UFOVP118_50 [uncultured Caudovirales phage]|uniref:Uncharacterized protein n=1 Tax=uncultured Caudovirales phage TaxID=2100421 RepID=A0A6J5L602_9CAUD|nr:hypothetical protein UFOVP118_50 [uncultured Caudovirales phage]
MVAKNDITGDAIQSRTNSKEYGDNFDRIFRKDKVVQPQPATDQPVELWTEADEKRQEIVGQNGNVGYDLDSIYSNAEQDYGS